MATPKHSPSPSPGRSVYGFAMYLVFRICLVLYFVWAAFSNWLVYYEISSPSTRYWYVTIPIFLVTVLTVFAFLIYPSFGMIMTPKVDNVATFKDRTSEKSNKNPNLYNRDIGDIRECVCKNKDKCSVELYQHESHNNCKMSIPVVEDLRIWEVSKYLHSKH